MKKEKEPERQKRFVLGAHSLSSMFKITNYVALKAAMHQAADCGAQIYEIPHMLCELDMDSVATATKKAKIPEISFCHFYPRDGKNAPAGDPLGSSKEQAAALEYLEKIGAAAECLRNEGIKVRFIDGPTWGCLAHQYEIPTKEQRKRVVNFLKRAGEVCQDHNLILAVEFLREVEDKVVGGSQAMVEILKEVKHPRVKMHFDIHHSVERGEDPADEILEAADYIAYLHFHGHNRVAPGSKHDECEWDEIIGASNFIEPINGPIPVIPEPFGDETCKENPALGQGLPHMGPLEKYLTRAYTTLRDYGLDA